jgi:Inorganic Pyrophosphatase
MALEPFTGQLDPALSSTPALQPFTGKLDGEGYSSIGEMAKAIPRGLMAGVGKIGGAIEGAAGTINDLTGTQALKGVGDIGHTVKDFANFAINENPDRPGFVKVNPQFQQDHPTLSAVEQGAEGVVPFLAGGAVGAAIKAPAVVSAAIPAIYGLAKQQEGTEEALKNNPGMSEPEARLRATPGGIAEGALLHYIPKIGEAAGETIKNAIPAFGPAAGDAVAGTVNPSLSRAIAGEIPGVAADTALFTGQGMAQNAIDKASGVNPNGDVVGDSLSVPNLTTSALLAGFFRGQHFIANKGQLEQARAALADPTADTGARTQAAGLVNTYLEKKNPQAAQNWRDNSSVAIHGLDPTPDIPDGVTPQAIPLDDSFLQHPMDVWKPAAADTAPDAVAPQETAAPASATPGGPITDEDIPDFPSPAKNPLEVTPDDGPLAKGLKTAGIDPEAPAASAPVRSDADLALDQAHEWAKGQVQEGNSSLMRMNQEPRDVYDKRILDTFQKSRSQVPTTDAAVSSIEQATAPTDNQQRTPPATLAPPRDHDAETMASVTDQDRQNLAFAKDLAGGWEKGKYGNGRSNKEQLFPWLGSWGKTTPAEVAQAIDNYLGGKRLGDVQQRLVAETIRGERERNAWMAEQKDEGGRMNYEGKPLTLHPDGFANQPQTADARKQRMTETRIAHLENKLAGTRNAKEQVRLRKALEDLKGKTAAMNADQAKEGVMTNAERKGLSEGGQGRQRGLLEQKAGGGRPKAESNSQPSVSDRQTDRATEIARAAHAAATSPLNDLPHPTEAQKEAGNYKKGDVWLKGLHIKIENPQGSKRNGVDENGKAWSTELKSHYGYIVETSQGKAPRGKDKDHLDVFIGPKPENGRVFLVDQKNPKTGTLDEHKIMIGFAGPLAARLGYLANYDKSGPSRIGAITETTMDGLKAWLANGNQKKAFAGAETAAKSEGKEPQALTDARQEALAFAGHERVAFAENKVRELGSRAAVDKKYPDDALLDNFARELAKEVYKDEVPEMHQEGGKGKEEVPDLRTQPGEQVPGDVAESAAGGETTQNSDDIPGHVVRAVDDPRQVSKQVGIATKQQTKETLNAKLASGEIPAKSPIRLTTVEELHDILESGKLREGKDFEGRNGISAQVVDGKKPIVAYGPNDRISAAIVFPEGSETGKGEQPNEVKVPATTDPKTLRFAVDGYPELMNFEQLQKAMAAEGAKHDSEPAAENAAQTANAPAVIGEHGAEKGENTPETEPPESKITPDLNVEKGAESKISETTAIPEAGAALYSNPMLDPKLIVKELTSLAGNVKEALPKLVELGRSVIDNGAETYREFVVGMKQHLGEMWQTFKQTMLKVYSQAREEYKKSLLGDETGAAGEDIQSPSTEKAKFVKASDASDNFGRITPEIGGEIRREAAPIRLREGNETEGLRHIEQRHGDDIRALGYPDAASFVEDVARNFDTIYQGKGKTLALVISKGKLKYASIQLEPADGGAFYDVKTATPGRNDQFKNKKPLWENAGPSVSSAERQTPLIPGAKETSSDSIIPPAYENVKYAKGQGEGTEKADIDTALTPLLKSWKNAPDVQVVQKVTELPKAVLDQMTWQEITGDRVQAVFYDGKVHLVADNLSSPEEAQKKLLHETVGHFGLRSVLDPEDFRKQMLQASLYYANKKTGEWKELGKTYGLDLKTPQGRMDAAEEMIAREAESGATSSVMTRIIAAVRDFVGKLGFNLDMSDAEIREMLGKARRFVEGEGQDVVDRGPAGARFAAAWHGSPHDFDRFSSDHIGNGEGAQAYGHGLYFAGNKEVAEHYKNKLSDYRAFYKDKEIDLYNGEPSIEKSAITYLSMEDGNLNKAIGRIGDDLKNTDFYSKQGRINLEKARDWLKNNIDDVRLDRKGNLYHVELAPKEDEYLLWDKPLSEQSEQVQAALPQIKEALGEGFVGEVEDHLNTDFDELTGNELYKSLVKYASESPLPGQEDTSGNLKQDASTYLHSLGIRGIKYLDGSSRDKGEGNYNYVVFSDADVEIKAKFALGKTTADTTGVNDRKEKQTFADRIRINSSIRAMENAWDGVAEVKKGLNRAFNPMANSPEAKSAGEGIREQIGRRGTEAIAFGKALDDATNPKNLQGFAKYADKVFNSYRTLADQVFARMSDKENIDFISRLQRNEAQPTPELDRLAKVVRKMFDAKFDAVETLTPGIVQYRQNYFPGIWKDPAKAEDFFRELAKNPLEGKKAFIKNKTFSDIEEGIKAGLVPVSYNPLDLVYLKMAEMDKYISAHTELQEMASRGVAKALKVSDPIPDGYKNVQEPYGIFHKQVTDEEGKKVKEAWRYVVPVEAAQVFNNYLSQNLYNNRYVGKLYTPYMKAANTLNSFQLGLSAFHAGFTSFEAVISHGALGAKALLNGDMRGAAKYFKEAPAAWITNPRLGGKLLEEIRNPGTHPELSSIAEAFALSGGRLGMDNRFHPNDTQKAVQDWANGRKLAAAARTPFAIVQQFARPIMEGLVPRQKLGVFAEMMNYWDERNPAAPFEERRAAAQQIMNRVDSRLGQVNYDRLFINNVAKNLVQALIRAPGWTGGTILEVGGGVKDLVGYFKDLALHAKDPKNTARPVATDRMAYTLSMLATTAIANGLLTALFTGDTPEGKDLLAFRTGKVDEKGNPERFMLPTYMKDVYAYASDPLKTLSNKTHPLLSLAGEEVRNKDYYGTEIRHEGDNIVEKAGQTLGYTAKAFIPFWMRGTQKEADRGGDALAMAAPLIGIMPAPSEMNLTPAQKVARDLTNARMPVGTKTQAETDRNQLVGQLTNSFRNKDVDASAKLNEALNAGQINRLQAGHIMTNAKLAPLVVAFKRLNYDEAVKVMEVAKPDEQKMLAPFMKTKQDNYERNNPVTKNQG